MQDINKKNIDYSNDMQYNVIIHRLMDYFKTDKFVKVEKELGFKPNTITMWKKRKSVNVKRLRSYCIARNIDPDLFLRENVEPVKSLSMIENIEKNPYDQLHKEISEMRDSIIGKLSVLSEKFDKVEKWHHEFYRKEIVPKITVEGGGPPRPK